MPNFIDKVKKKQTTTTTTTKKAYREQLGPKKQSKLLDFIHKIMLEMAVASIMDLV